MIDFYVGPAARTDFVIRQELAAELHFLAPASWGPIGQPQALTTPMDFDNLFLPDRRCGLRQHLFAWFVHSQPQNWHFTRVAKSMDFPDGPETTATRARAKFGSWWAIAKHRGSAGNSVGLLVENNRLIVTFEGQVVEDHGRLPNSDFLIHSDYLLAEPLRPFAQAQKKQALRQTLDGFLPQSPIQERGSWKSVDHDEYSACLAGGDDGVTGLDLNAYLQALPKAEPFKRQAIYFLVPSSCQQIVEEFDAFIRHPKEAQDLLQSNGHWGVSSIQIIKEIDPLLDADRRTSFALDHNRV